MNSFHKILFATDFTPASEPAFRQALDLAFSDGAELWIAHVYEPPSLMDAQSIAAGVYEEWDQALRAEAERRLTPLVDRARERGVKARALVLSGMPYEAISEAAREKGADLLVVGTHGRTGVARLFVGSVASRVISTAPCPVLAVRAAA